MEDPDVLVVTAWTRFPGDLSEYVSVTKNPLSHPLSVRSNRLRVPGKRVDGLGYPKGPLINKIDEEMTARHLSKTC